MSFYAPSVLILRGNGLFSAIIFAVGVSGVLAAFHGVPNPTLRLVVARPLLISAP